MLPSLIFLLPILVATLTTVIAVTQILVERSHALSTCRSEVIAIQKEMLNKKNKLQALNSSASRLRKELKAAKAMIVAAAGIPPALAAATTYYRSVKARQSLLSLRQKAILYSARIMASSKIMNLKQKLSKRKTITKSHGLSRFDSPWFPKLELDPRPRTSLTPDYKTPQNYSRRQNIEIAWTYDETSLLHEWIIDRVQLPKPLKLACGATIKRRNAKWTVVLSADKS